jgi:hypothetical protein
MLSSNAPLVVEMKNLPLVYALLGLYLLMMAPYLFRVKVDLDPDDVGRHHEQVEAQQRVDQRQVLHLDDEGRVAGQHEDGGVGDQLWVRIGYPEIHLSTSKLVAQETGYLGKKLLLYLDKMF